MLGGAAVIDWGCSSLHALSWRRGGTQEGWHSVGIAAKKLRGQACAEVLAGVRPRNDDAANR